MKHINDVGIPVVFIVNQIDKHQDDEYHSLRLNHELKNQLQIGALNSRTHLLCI